MPIYLEIVPFLTSPITEGKVLAYTTIILFGWSVLLHIVCFSGVPLLLSLSKNSNRSTRQAVLPPTAPYSIPYWNHTRAYVSGREKYASTLMRHCGAKIPILFRLVGLKIALISNPAHIRSILYSPHVFVDYKVRARFIQNVLGLRSKALKVALADTSGSDKEPVRGSNVPPGRRIMRMQHENTFDVIARSGVNEMLTQFVQSFDSRMFQYDIGTEWIEYPDLYVFLRDLGFRSTVDALCGPKFLEITPEFDDSFWEFDANLHFLYIGWPTWLKPSAANARKRCVEAVCKWRASAVEHSKGKDYSDSVMWDEIWGLKPMRLRNEMFEKFEEFDNVARSSSDLGVIWGANVNAVPATYWYMLALLQSHSLLDRCVKEMERARSFTTGKALPYFDAKVLSAQPLLQSLFSEVLRTKITTNIARTSLRDYKLDDYLLPRGSMTITSAHLKHMDREVWETRQGAKIHPVEEFWPERFLSYPDEHAEGKTNESRSEPTYSLKGLEATFIPFGIGRTMCPGRHFAKREVLTVAAMLLSTYDIELLVPPGWTPTDDLQTYAYSTLRPVEKTPFRIRRKISTTKRDSVHSVY